MCTGVPGKINHERAHGESRCKWQVARRPQPRLLQPQSVDNIRKSAVLGNPSKRGCKSGFGWVNEVAK